MTRDDDDWVNGVITLTIPLEGVTPDSPASEKAGALELLHDDFWAALGPQWHDAVSSARWEDATGDESL